MRNTLLSWLPQTLQGARLLDAGCGTGALSVEAARRGAIVTAIDLSPTLINLARERTPRDLAIDFRVGDMTSPALGHFDFIVAMDSLIHYCAPDMAAAVAALAARAEQSVLFTFAPRTKLLTLMHTAGRLFPRADRAPAIEPVSPRDITRRLSTLRLRREHRVSSGFYMSHALEVARR